MPTTDKTLTFTVASGSSSQTVLGVSGDKFTINGTPTFLLGCSYFQALNWHQSDITSLQSRGFNWIRIFLEHWNTDGAFPPAAQLASLQSNGTFTGSASILSLIDYCDARGIVVEIVIFDWESFPVSSAPLTAITNVTAALQSKGNIFYDVMNEHNLYSNLQHSTIQQWITAVKAGDPGAIVKSSTARGHIGGTGDGNTTIFTADINADLGTGANLISPHFDRGSGWQTATTSRVTQCKSHLVSVGQNKPVLLDEESRFGSDAVSPTEFPTALLNAYNAGAAGWLYHNNKNFYLNSSSMFSQFTANDLTVVNGLAAVIAPADDWVTRSQAAGVFLANQLDTQAIIDDWRFPDSQGSYMTLDTTIKPAASAAGSLRFQILNTDGAGSGQFSIPFGQNRGEGTTTYIQFLVRMEADDCYQPYPPANWEQATKLCIISRDGNGTVDTGSNQVNEVVLQLNDNVGELTGYNRNVEHSYAGWDETFSSACPNSTLKTRYAFNRGVNPLSGTNPDTGAAWTACEQVAGQYGRIYGRVKNPGTIDARPGYGDPFSGCFRLNPREWLCFEIRIIAVAFGTTNNRITVWGAVQGQAPTLLFDLPNIGMGAPAPPYNAINLLPYTTYRDPGGRKISARSNAIPGIEIYAAHPSTPLGNGQLEYTASTGRIRWQAFGESFGAPRGFSAPNNILVRNVLSMVGASESTTSYLIVKATPGSLPTSGTHTETVTIANGRPDTQRHYARVIASSNPINFPGGFAPVLP